MRIKFALAAIFLPALLAAQEQVSVRGKIVDEKGNPVEYVQVGVPERHIGTISTVDGLFEISVPIDTLEFFHVSYQTARYSVTGPADNVVIVLHENELPPAVSIGGNTKEKYLVRPGMNVFGKGGSIGFSYSESRENKGMEIGSIATAKKPFLIRNIHLTIKANYVPGCVAAISVYRIEDESKTFVNVLHKPIYFNIAESGSSRDYDIQPDESILLEPGKYFVGFRIVGYDEDALLRYLETPVSERSPTAMSLYTPVYFKSSYIRHAAMGKMEHLPVNIGVAVKGLEYQ